MVSGIINVYKEAGYTSHDVVAKLRGIFGQKKIGHTGTLDPGATGVLPVCLGKATKVCELLTNEDKTYRCVMLLGRCTDTQDTSGRILSEQAVTVTDAAVREAVMSFLGDYHQVPPMYSALKVQGKKLYELARAGKEVERAPRLVKILSIRILDMELPRVTLEVDCSRGTYIRTLCADIGQKLGCGGCMEDLMRTRVAGFQLQESHTLGAIEALVREGRGGELLIPVDRMFAEDPAVLARPEAEKALDNGNRLPIALLTEWRREWTKERLRLYDSQGRFVGLYQYQPREDDLKPVKIFYEKE